MRRRGPFDTNRSPFRETSRPAFRALAFLAAVVAVGLLGASVASAQAERKWPSSSAPRPLAARDVRFPPYELSTLPNGLRLVVIRHDEQPMVSVRMIVGAGGAEDPADKPGVAALLTTLLDQGTATRSAEQVAAAIDSVGGQLTTGLGRDLSFVHVVVMRDALELGMSLLADVVRRPAFDATELERQRKQTLSALQVSYQDPEFLANLLFDRLVYGPCPYGAPGNGTPASVARITRDDLVAFHRAYFAPNNCLIAVVGAVSTEEATGAVTRAFGDWERRDVVLPNAVPPPAAARRVIVLDKPDAVQTEIRVGHVGIPRKTRDYDAVDLAVKILGGEGANRLHRVLRMERGLTYGASAECETLKRSGQIVARTNTRSEATGEALRVISDEFARLWREHVNDRELEDAKAYLTGHFPLTIETPDDIAAQVLDVLFYDLPVEELQTFRQRVNAIGVDDVARAAGNYLKPDRLSVVLVGNAAAFLGQLKGVGFGKYEVIRLSDLDLALDGLREGRVPAVQAASVGGAAWPAGLSAPWRALAVSGAEAAFAPGQEAVQVTAREPGVGQGARAPQKDEAAALIRRAVEAKGGIEKLKAVRTVQATSSTTLMLPQGPVSTETTTYIEYPDHFRVEARVSTGLVVQVYAGDGNVWVQDPSRGVRDVPAQARHDFKNSVDRDLIPLLLRTASGELTPRMIAPEAGTSAEENVRVVEITGANIDPVRLFIDTSSGMVMRESYKLPGGTGTAEEVFSDYREVAGVKVAYKASVLRNNLPVLERTVSDFKVNPVLRPGLFEKPQAK